MNKSSKIYVSGHSGLVGTAVINFLKLNGFTNILTQTHEELDLLDQKNVLKFFEINKPEYVIHLAAKVGGIVGNKTYPADFNYENTQISMNVIHSSHTVHVKKLLNLGSVCIYPVNASTPIKEEYLLTGPLEYSNEAYAISKINSLILCKKYFEQYGDNFISAMPANIFGRKDNFHPQNAHVIPMLIKRIHDAKINNLGKVTIWGTGKPTRDFIFADDLAEGIFFLMNNYSSKEHINISTGVETSIESLAKKIVSVVGYKGDLFFDESRPDGTPKRYMDTTKINNLGWKSKFSLSEGLDMTYSWFLENYEYIQNKYN